MSLATVLTTVAWASSTATFCSRVRCNSARASGDVIGRWALDSLGLRGAGRQNAQHQDAQQQRHPRTDYRSLQRPQRSPFQHHRWRSFVQDTSNSMSLIDRSASPPEVSSNRLQSTSAELPPLPPCRSASRWHLMQYVA